MGKLFNDLKKINELSECMDDSEMGNISDYISTGSYSFNGILSGSIFKGIPVGRISSVLGESGTGKSLIAGRLVAEAQKKGYDVVWFDSENATDKHFLRRLGVDTKKVLYVPIITIEEFKHAFYKMLQKIEEKHEGAKVFFVLDSLGNLVTEKELNDADTGHEASDMGLRAKKIKAMTRVVSGKLSQLDLPFFIVNHGYADPSSKSPRIVPQGGMGVRYLSTIMCLMSKAKETNTKTKKVEGNVFTMTTIKNRLIPEEKKAKIQIDFIDGINPYYGLLEDAVEFGLIKKISAQKYTVPHIKDKEFSKKQLWVDAVWQPILQKFDEKYQEKYRFASVTHEDIEETVELLEE